jgi:hypothetical protein
MSYSTAKPGTRPPSIDEIKARYTIADAWRDEGLPGAPGKSCKSPFREDQHASFSVYEEGRKFKDHGDGAQGDVIDFLALARRCPMEEALAVARERIGWQPNGQGPTQGRMIDTARRPAAQEAEPKYKPRIMDGDVRTAWEAGRHWLKIDDATAHGIDRWRAWPIGTAQFLADQGLLSAPEWKGQRGIAWLVQYPGRNAWGEVGFHMRHKARREGERAIWTYAPAGIGLPGVPLILGNYYGARLVIVCEGEWDAATFAAAAGWLRSPTTWPDAIAVVGIRGATGWRAFIEHWRKVWPKRARFLLIPDNDAAGAKWRTEFAGALAPLALSVTVLPPKEGGPKDFNDLHRQQPFTVGEIYALLQSCGLVDERGRPL